MCSFVEFHWIGSRILLDKLLFEWGSLTVLVLRFLRYQHPLCPIITFYSTDVQEQLNDIHQHNTCQQPWLFHVYYRCHARSSGDPENNLTNLPFSAADKSPGELAAGDCYDKHKRVCNDKLLIVCVANWSGEAWTRVLNETSFEIFFGIQRSADLEIYDTCWMEGVSRAFIFSAISKSKSVTYFNRWFFDSSCIFFVFNLISFDEETLVYWFFF